jgi:hypothetical protein
MAQQKSPSSMLRIDEGLFFVRHVRFDRLDRLIAYVRQSKSQKIGDQGDQAIKIAIWRIQMR